jgi:hypothetical protein
VTLAALGQRNMDDTGKQAVTDAAERAQLRRQAVRVVLTGIALGMVLTGLALLPG